MTPIDLTKPINVLMEEHPEYLLAFGKLHFDYDLNQNLTLNEFCALRHLNAQDVISAMEDCNQWSHFSEERHLQDLDVPQLIGYVLFTHHAPLKNELPFLEQLLDEAVHVDGKGRPELKELSVYFKNFKQTLEEHMRVEEKLFSILMLMSAQGSSVDFDWKQIESLTQVVHGEDEEIQNTLGELTRLTKDFQVPAGVMGAYRFLLRELSRMEFKFRRHVWVETSILYPKVMALIRMELAHGGPRKI